MVRLIAGGAGAAQMAAAEQGLKAAANDPGAFDVLAGYSAAVDAGGRHQTRRAATALSSRPHSEGV